MRIYQSIAKQRLFRNPTDLRQFFCRSPRIYLFFEAKLAFYFPDIRNSMGVYHSAGSLRMLFSDNFVKNLKISEKT